MPHSEYGPEGIRRPDTTTNFAIYSFENPNPATISDCVRTQEKSAFTAAQKVRPLFISIVNRQSELDHCELPAELTNWETIWAGVGT